MKALKVALIGLGRIGWKGFPNREIETHFRALTTYAGLNLAAVCDTDEEALGVFRVEHPEVRTFTNFHECIEKSRAQIVVVATPPETHFEIADRCARAGGVQGVIIEKPIATTVAAGEEIVRLLAKKTLVVGHQRRYEGRHRALHTYLLDGNLGPVLAANAWFSGGYLNNGSHAVDLCRMFAGDHVPWTIKRVESGFGIHVVGEHGGVILKSDGALEPGYLHEMYSDLIDCMESPNLTPACSGRDGVEAVRHALFAEERDAHAA